MEIERKFRLSPTFVLPGVESDYISVDKILQGYILDCNGTMRVRSTSHGEWLNVKGPGLLAREEWETPIPTWVFKQLWSRTVNKRITKTRYTKQYGKHTLEIDCFHGALKNLWLLECEFTSVAAAHAFVLPAWAHQDFQAYDVTENPTYANSHLATLDGPPVFTCDR